jgi:hypothetical protein
MSLADATLRPAGTVMSAARAAAIVPNALSFPRAAMRELVRGRWRIEKLRFELDDNGCGEVLYRLVGGGWVFHFFLISNRLPEAQKTDRNFAASWDAMGVLCQGEWTPEREALLRREVPKQRAGHADYDTLVYARGNRSGRIFDHVVDSLAAGRQPDLAQLAPVGYILRTTAFIGNGQLGTRPLAGFEPDHPLRRPYHAQFCSGFMLREYVFDLVDHLARARSRDAVRLAPAYRRFLGLGNSAATGLAAYVANHPHLMHQWNMAGEQALAHARQRTTRAQDPEARQFAALLDKAIRHFTEGARPSDGVFAAPQALAAELQRLRDAMPRIRVAGDGQAALPWSAFCDWAERHVSTEACEILNAILIELHPDIVDALSDAFHADERFTLQPTMRADELRQALRADYGWALELPPAEVSSGHFWYRSSSAPRDVRRGLRGREQAFEAETPMDTLLQVRRLWDCLQEAADEMPVADLVCARPDLRHIVARVQSLHGLAYAELREQYLSERFAPFATIRFALIFYGMEKLEAAFPKSVRGTFLQGAPIAEEVELGREGDWPFPLMPTPDADARLPALAPLPVSSFGTKTRAWPEAATGPQVLKIAPRELGRMVQTALQGHGAALGVAEDAAGLVVFAQACAEPALAAQLRHCAEGLLKPAGADDLRAKGRHPAPSVETLDVRGGSALLAAPPAIDLACARAHAASNGIGAAWVLAARDGWLAKAAVLRCAQERCIGLLTWHDAAAPEGLRCGFALAGPGANGAWYASGSAPGMGSLHAQLLDVQGTDAQGDRAAALLSALALSTAEDFARSIAAAVAAPPAAPSPADAGFLLVCIRAGDDARAALVFDALARAGVADQVWAEGEACRREQAWLREGIDIARAEFDALAAAGATLLVPQAQEHRVLHEGFDPLKKF